MQKPDQVNGHHLEDVGVRQREEAGPRFSTKLRWKECTDWPKFVQAKSLFRVKYNS